MPKPAFIKWSPLAIAIAADCLFFINICSVIFKCGCRSLWSGADMACNIHMQHMKHCPFCAHGWQGQALVMTAIIVPQIVITARAPWAWIARFSFAMVMFPIAEGIAALLFGWSDGYWNH